MSGFGFEEDGTEQHLIGANIKVLGAGGGGGNAINTMIASGFTGVTFIAANTDKQALASNSASIKIQLGKELTSGLGAGGNPDVGKSAALEDVESVKNALNGSDMIFITAGMGGGTGTGAAPVIASIAREMGILTVAVVTTPFFVEGVKRQRQAEFGLEELRKYVDTLIIIPNERLLNIVGQESLEDSFKKVDNVLLQAVRGVSDLINKTGQMNLDFADIKSVMKNSKGVAIVGIGSAAGDDRAKKAAKAAITSPLLGNLKIEGATGLIVNITAGSNIALKEIIDAVTYIKECAGGAADVKMGVVKDESLANEVRMTVVATGIIPNYDIVKEEAKPAEPSTVVTSSTRNVEETTSTQEEVTAPRRRRPIREEEQTEGLFDNHRVATSGGNDDDWDTPAFLKKGKKITTEVL